MAAIYIFKHSFKTHRCLISQIDALSMPFSMGDEKGIDIDARLRSSMPSGTPAYAGETDTGERNQRENTADKRGPDNV